MALHRLHLRKINRLRKHTQEGMARAARDWPTARDPYYGRTLAQRQKHNRRLHPYQRAIIAGILRPFVGQPNTPATRERMVSALTTEYAADIQSVSRMSRQQEKNQAFMMGFDTPDGYYDRERHAVVSDMEAGRDPHLHAAARRNRCDVKDVTPEMRQEAKARNFALVYPMMHEFAGGLKKGEVGVVMSRGDGKSKTAPKDKFLDPTRWKNNMIQPAHPDTVLVAANFEELEKRIIGVDMAKEGDYDRTVIVHTQTGRHDHPRQDEAHPGGFINRMDEP